MVYVVIMLNTEHQNKLHKELRYIDTQNTSTIDVGNVFTDILLSLSVYKRSSSTGLNSR